MRQFRVLYREFLFRIVDRELLSTHAKGDASQLLLQLVTLLAFLSACFSLPVLSLDVRALPQAQLMFAWSIEHFLIATTMLVVGVFAVLSWESMFPGHRDVLVLAPLPIRAHTILLAKLSAVATALSLTVAALHIVAGVVWPLALTAATPAGAATSAAGTWIRLLAAYWLTMIAAGVFIFGLAMSAQGIAASLLPRRYFVRVSSFLQLAAFSAIVAGYFLQPMVVRPGALLLAQQGGIFSSSPTYWFLGLCQALSGSPTLDVMAGRAYMGLTLAIGGMAIAYVLSYLRTLRRIAEQPDIAPAVTRVRWLPTFGNGPQTAIVQFSIRTLVRSAQHRVILAFYWGMGFAAAILLMIPRGGRPAADSGAATWQESSVPPLVACLMMMAFAVLAARMAFAMPRDLPANWIFRILPVRGGSPYVSARRRALFVASVVPVWGISAIVFLSIWPWRPAAGHLLALAVLSMTFVEVALSGTQKIPFTCLYLPGRSQAHVTIYVATVIGLPFILKAAIFETDALRNPFRYAAMLGVLGVVWGIARWRTSWLENAAGAEPEFEDEPAGQPLTLDVWDSRFAPHVASAPAAAATSRKQSGEADRRDGSAWRDG